MACGAPRSCPSRLGRALASALVLVAIVAAARGAHAEESDETAPTSPGDDPLPPAETPTRPQPLADRSPSPRATPPSERTTGGLELRLGVAPLVLGDERFSGYGVDATGAFKQIGASGRDLGVVRPTFHFFDLALNGSAGLAYGGMAVAYGTSGADRGPLDASTAAQFDTRGLSFLRGSIEGGVGAWTGPLRWNVGLLLGLAGVRMDLTQLHQRESCSKDCGGYASALHVWIQPRVSAEYLLQNENGFGLGLGAYVGDNLLQPRETELGLTLSFRSVHDPT